MFTALKAEVTNRILQIEVFFNAIHRTPPDGGIPAAESGSMMARGLTFVALYGVWEYTVRTSVEAAILELAKHAKPIRDIRFELLAFILHPECEAAGRCGRDSMWEKRIALFCKTGSVDPFKNDNLPFPNDGSHYRKEQLQTIWRLFGITDDIVPDIRLLGRIEEMIVHRNDIGHGDRTGVEVGCRYSADDMRKIINAVQLLCLHVVTTLELHCSLSSNFSR